MVSNVPEGITGQEVEVRHRTPPHNYMQYLTSDSIDTNSKIKYTYDGEGLSNEKKTPRTQK